MGFSREVKLQWGVLWFLSSQQEAAAVGRPAASKLIAQELPREQSQGASPKSSHLALKAAVLTGGQQEVQGPGQAG